MILVKKTGQKISFLYIYTYRSNLFKDLILYDYISVVILKKKRKAVVDYREVEFDNL